MYSDVVKLDRRFVHDSYIHGQNFSERVRYCAQLLGICLVRKIMRELERGISAHSLIHLELNCPLKNQPSFLRHES